jgi:peroxiredoxin
MRLGWLAIGVGAMALGSASAAQPPATQPVTLPRYHLHVGQELTYADTGFFKYITGSFSSGSNDVYDVVAENPDGEWHVVGRLTSWFNQREQEKKLVAFDIQPDGSAHFSKGVDAQFENLPAEFPTLPADATEAQNGWQRPMTFGGRTLFKSLPTTRRDIVSFTGVTEDSIDKIYLMTNRTTFAFDPTRGLMLTALGTNSQGYGFVGKGGDVTALSSETEKPRQWIDQYAHDADVYFAAQAKYSDASDRAQKDPAHCDSEIAARLQFLKDARRGVNSPEIAEVLDKQIAAEPQEAQYLKDDAQRRQAIVDKPAPTWTLSDLDGGKHTLEDYRGKVVVLDFWYRGCGWCMRAMPQMKQLAVDFAGKPVVFLGMNTDSDPADPKFVVNAFGLNYPVVHVDNTLVQQYQVRGFPTLFVIGPDGIVREMEVGYTPTLHDDLTKKIEALLATK